MNGLRGEKVVLRPIIKEDLPLLNKWKNEENIYKYLGGGFLPVSIDIQSQWMENLMDTTGNNKRFIIETIEEKPIGMIGLYTINWIWRNCELGILIGDLSEQGKGYASDAYKVIESYALNYLNLRKIKAFVVKNNDEAVAMYEWLGFRRAGELLEERFIEGKYYSVLIVEKIL